MRKFFFAFILAAATLVAPTASADGVSDVRTLIQETYRADPERFIWKQMNGPDDRGFRVVFVHEGRRYTVDHDWWTDGIQIWERPDGTGGLSVVDAYADNNSDGVVDFGADGERLYVGPDHRRLGLTGQRATQGAENRALWQRRYDRALIALAATVRE